MQHVAEQPQANRKNKLKVHDNYTAIPQGCCFGKAKQAFLLVKPAFLLNCTFKITACLSKPPIPTPLILTPQLPVTHPLLGLGDL